MPDETVATRHPWLDSSLPRLPCRGISVLRSTILQPLSSFAMRSCGSMPVPSPCPQRTSLTLWLNLVYIKIRGAVNCTSVFTILLCFYLTQACFLVRPRSFFSTSFLGTITWCPQPMHFRRKSAPTRMISHSLLPHGCGFLSFTISPTAYLSILYSSSIYACHLICCVLSSVYTSICSNTEPSPCCIRRSALASIGVVDLLISTSLFPL